MKPEDQGREVTLKGVITYPGSRISDITIQNQLVQIPNTILEKEMKQTSIQPILYWRDHVSSGDIVRVWRNVWGGNMFELLSKADLEILEKFCKRFGIPLVKYNDEDD